MITLGDTVIVKLAHGQLQVTVDDDVEPDLSSGQYEPGWWVIAEGYDPEVDEHDGLYFLSAEGILYRWEPEDSGYSRAIGEQLELAAQARED